MSYQKDPIETSLIKLPKASHCKTAIKIFKNLLVYMGDLNSKSVSEENAITSILKTGINTPELRDEIYVQVLKQLTNNPNGESEINGWCASCLLAHSFIPTRNLQTFVEDYFQKYSRNGKNKKIKKYARYSFRTLRATIRSNIFATPNPQLISTINIRPFERNIFGIPLEEVREIETKEGSNTRIPRILIYLYQNIEKYNGFQTQGIFRVPGNTNSVKELKQHLNRDPDFSNIDESDPMVFASTLKLFFRELDPPTIPYRYYQEFVNSDNWEQLESLINKFTDYNKLIFASLIHFFQKLTQPKYVKITKMNIDNISMVFAPNLLRKLDINSMIYSSEVPGKTQIGLIIKNWNVSSILN
ncbi:rho gtpase activation protein [Anaeramoeba flamelloides]|nr:rho gtpase activation protein [Anaeramoeba flamelloides]